jgi:hypothetical protein
MEGELRRSDATHVREWSHITSFTQDIIQRIYRTRAEHSGSEPHEAGQILIQCAISYYREQSVSELNTAGQSTLY